MKDEEARINCIIICIMIGGGICLRGYRKGSNEDGISCLMEGTLA